MIETFPSGTRSQIGPSGIRRQGCRTRGTGSAAPFAPTDIAGIELWLKADALALSDGTAVATWTDSSGAANNATQVTGANQPLYKTAILNSLPIVRFDGTNDSMTVAGITNNDATRTIFFVAAVGAAPPASGIFYSLSGVDACVFDNAGVWTYTANQAGGNSTVGAGATSSFAVVTIRYNSTASADGFVGTSAAANFDPHDNYQVTGSALRLGSNVAGTTNFLKGDIAEVLSYNSALSESDRGSVRDYLKTKYGI